MENTENLITVDLNKTVIIPIKEPFNKRQLAHFVVDYFEYDKGKTEIKEFVYKGSYDDFLNSEFFKPNLIISNIDETNVYYQEIIVVPYEKSKMEFGIEKYLKPSTDFLINILTEAQIKKSEVVIEYAKAQLELELQKKLIEEQLESIRDINLK